MSALHLPSPSERLQPGGLFLGGDDRSQATDLAAGRQGWLARAGHCAHFA